MGIISERFTDGLLSARRFYHMTGYGPDEVLGHNWCVPLVVCRACMVHAARCASACMGAFGF